MGVSLFGVNIGLEVHQALEGAGGVLPLTLVKVTPGTRNPAALLDGTNPTEVSHAGKGFAEDPVDDGQSTTFTAGDIIRVRVTEISILGASLPSGVEPLSNDRVVFSSAIPGIGDLAGTWFITKVETDPARALFVCRARSGG